MGEGGRRKKSKEYYYNNKAGWAGTNNLLMMMIFFLPFPPKNIIIFNTKAGRAGKMLQTLNGRVGGYRYRQVLKKSLPYTPITAIIIIIIISRLLVLLL